MLCIALFMQLFSDVKYFTRDFSPTAFVITSSVYAKKNQVTCGIFTVFYVKTLQKNFIHTYRMFWLGGGHRLDFHSLFLS